LQYIQAPSFAEVGASATGIWTHQQDQATPYPNADGTLPEGTTVKPVQQILCPTTAETLVDAIPTRLQIGNAQAMFSPEWVEGFTVNVMANAARVAETKILTGVSSFSTSVSSGQLLGAARDFLSTVDQAVAAFRWRNRLADSVPITALLPSWTVQMLRVDLTRELAHGEDTNLDLSENDIVSLIRNRGVDPIFFIDGLDASTGPVAFPAQGFGAQSEGALLDWPTATVWWMFATGTIVRLDGGRLDLSVVRDPTYNAVNVFETFTETFEGLIYRGGPEVLEVVSALRPNGQSAGTVSTSTY
jgi:hypothetical protein